MSKCTQGAALHLESAQQMSVIASPHDCEESQKSLCEAAAAVSGVCHWRGEAGN